MLRGFFIGCAAGVIKRYRPAEAAAKCPRTGKGPTMTAMTETPEARRKKLAMRAARRGMKEMDIVLGPYARARLSDMTEAQIDLFDRLLWENDQDILPWILGQVTPPEPYAILIGDIIAFARENLALR